MEPNGTVEVKNQELAASHDWRNGANTTLTGLTPFTKYTIEVAAVNENGDVGVRTNHITILTLEDSKNC